MAQPCATDAESIASGLSALLCAFIFSPKTPNHVAASRVDYALNLRFVSLNSFILTQKRFFVPVFTLKSSRQIIRLRIDSTENQKVFILCPVRNQIERQRGQSRTSFN